ncbi:NADPH-dependent oxidoreductase [Pseudomonas sp. NFX224]|uniref:NADPH-dependent oxidoreductase n=1 Tax=Pseudomonas sp. NFX224 TaxID=3402862 RepID=UPI003AFB45AB
MTNDSQSRMALRYGQPDILAPGNWSSVIDHLLEHRSVRSFADTPLPSGTLEALIAAAQSAASSSNLQVWSVVAIESSERKALLAELSGNQSHIRQAPLFLVWLADLSRVERVAQRERVELEAVPYIESLLLGTIDAALAAQNAVIALESLGLGSVYIGAIRNDIEGVAQILKLPPQVFPVFGLCIGYPDPDSPAQVKPRLPQAAVLHHETYATEHEEESINRYDERLSEFYKREGLTAKGWSDQVINRLLRVDSLHGREHLATQLARLGFGLR